MNDTIKQSGFDVGSNDLIGQFIENAHFQISVDKITHSIGAMSAEQKQIYQDLASGNAEAVTYTIYETIIIDNMKMMGRVFSEEISKLGNQHKIYNIALALGEDNAVVLWIEVDGWETEKQLYRIQRKINAEFEDKRIHLIIRVSHVEDGCGVPYGFQSLVIE